MVSGQYQKIIITKKREELSKLYVESFDFLSVSDRISAMAPQSIKVNKINKAETLEIGLGDFDRLLHKPDTEKALYWDRGEFTKVSGVKDDEIIKAAAKAIDNGEEITLDYAIKNTDRAVTTMLSGVIAKKYGEAGLPDSTINIKFNIIEI